MAERLANLEVRIGSVRQLSTVVTAMRGIAVARSREARERLDGIRAYAASIAAAIGEALSLLPEPPPSATDGGRHAIVAFCAEQGFAGTFNERVLDAVGALTEAEGERPHSLFLIGDRGLMVADERGLGIDWSTRMISHVVEAAELAERIVQALDDRLESEDITEVTIVHTGLSQGARTDMVVKRLIPFDYSRFQTARPADPPLITLPPQRLVEGLAQEYVFAELCEAAIISFAAENEARTRAMIAAKNNVGKTLDELTALSRQLRQEEITNEVIELAGRRGDEA
ncbi:F0F1 ATP synthase subunit gamma [Rhizobium sp. S153]|uniref:F0F1 ATP synthase subunit gamma n=1 Tax=Ciceribacter sichuanensis TaxID=2949647 RepID=A0ABT0VEB1_9HYPH|nr:FoF1 ATP synthase subunit gamma [Ciceribacter sp. S153]MCM2402748.1 F0F1 ATP synthase subunit gamma [Ciceribacter sp. S153]